MVCYYANPSKPIAKFSTWYGLAKHISCNSIMYNFTGVTKPHETSCSLYSRHGYDVLYYTTSTYNF